MESFRRNLGRRSSLWSNTDFIRFWIGETIANFGSHLGLIALPLIAAVTLDASPFEMGLLAASSNLPRMIVGVFAGAWVDGRKRRPIMIGVNIARALTLLVIPVTALLGILNFPLLLAISVLLGMLGIIFDSAWSAMVPNLVDRQDLADANGKLWASMSLAQIMGPAIAGTLIAILTGPNVLALTSIALLISAWFMRQIQKQESAASLAVHTTPKQVLSNIREGYAELVRNRVVQPLSTTMIGINFGSGVFGAVFLLLLTDELGLGNGGVGAVYAVGGLGALVGSMAAAPLAKRFGYGRIITIGPFIQGVCNLMFTVAVFSGQAGVAIVALASFVGWIFLQAYDINRFSLRQAVTRPNLMGRVASSSMTLVAAAMMLGALIGGTVGEIWGLAPALALGALSQIGAGFLTLYSPVPQIMELPNLDFDQQETVLVSPDNEITPEMIPAEVG